MTVKTKTIDYYLPGKNLKLSVVEDIEALITDPNDPDKVPCWADIWPAARAMGLHIWEKLDLKGASVLELGCGLGLPGVVAGLKGAEVTFSDFNPDAVDLALTNARLSELSKTKGFVGDWRNFQLKEQYDYILASDICYEPNLNIFLEDIFVSNLKEGGKLLVSHPERAETVTMLERLRKSAAWEEEAFHIPITIEDSLFPHYVITINQMTFKNS